jgi:excisionase family DNA binding protein
MHTSTPKTCRPAYYTVHQAAAILGVEPSRISRAIRLRTLRAVRQRGRLLVPANALAALLGAPVDDDQPSGGTP